MENDLCKSWIGAPTTEKDRFSIKTRCLSMNIGLINRCRPIRQFFKDIKIS